MRFLPVASPAPRWRAALAALSLCAGAPLALAQGAVATPAAGTSSPFVGANPSPTAPIPATDPAARPAGAVARTNGAASGLAPGGTGVVSNGSDTGAGAAPKKSSGIYRSQGPGGSVRYGALDTPGAMEVTRESIRTREVTAPPLDSITPEYRAEVADTCQTWRDRVNAWKNAREVFMREPDGQVRRLSDPERARTVGRFSTTATYWCRKGAAEKIQAEYRQAEARRAAAEEKAALAAAKVIKVEQR